MEELAKVNTKLMINSMLLGAIVSLFFLVASLQPTLLSDDPLLALQMVLAVPFLVTACISSTFIGKPENRKIWYNFGWTTFLIGYAFTLNCIGIIIAAITSNYIGGLYFFFSCFLPVIYSYLLVKYEDKNLKERFFKDAMFISLQLIFGVAVMLHWVG